MFTLREAGTEREIVLQQDKRNIVYEMLIIFFITFTFFFYISWTLYMYVKLNTSLLYNTALIYMYTDIANPVIQPK